ncbi:hypothetical protein AOZ07_11545 [Glutamicibacter halophytocola]|uniref:recombinase family protein n=1 Tax=Glutamicibacter halophytocola TaxID=1933880 RepID=UPI0006D4B6AB|nr:recombinase family protein [Glutamicibacter halophytocola]ALG30876.1 hypothetical protein AOZ07_11545 [Glutamicibacter halophytocola]
MTSEPRRAALYARQSKADPDGIDRQLPRIRKLANERGWVIVDEYVDDGLSASKSRGPGSNWARMLADADAGKIDTVIGVDLDRLLRSLQDLLVLIEHNLMAVTVSGDIDLSTADGEFRATMLAAIARFEVRRKAERQSRAQLQRAMQGRAPKGVRPLGYATNGDLIEDEAAAVHEIFRLFAISDGPSIASIAKGLSGLEADYIPASLPHLPKRNRTLAIERNVRRTANGEDPAPVPSDGPWDSSTVLGILRNPRYAGYSVYTDRNARAENKRRTWYAQIVRDEDGDPIAGQWTPIVEPDVWWTVQERLNAPERVTNRTGSTARKHIGSGLFLCGICEKPVKAHSQRYRCEGHIMRSREQIDQFVLAVVRERLGRPDLVDTIPSLDEPRLQAIRAEIGIHEGRIKRAQNDYDNELIEGHDLKRTRDRELTKIAALEKERRNLTITTDLGGVLDAKSPVKAFDDADLMIKRRVIDFFMTVKLHPHPRGKKTFDPTTVEITPRAVPGTAADR